MNQAFKLFFTAGISCVFFLVGAGKGNALPQGFQNTVISSGFTLPTAIAIAPNGKIYVTEKSGIIKVFDNAQDSTPTIFADLRPKVLDFNDRGLLGITVDPQFPTRPYVYVIYSLDALPGGTTPHYNDICPNPDFCPASSRLSRLTASASGNTMTAESVLSENWCGVESAHSAGMLAFGTDGALYVTHGDGASYNYVDYGQDGGCPDPVNEGGSLRSQDIRTSGDPVGFAGSLLRIHPDTGAAFSGNPLIGGSVTDDDPIIAYGFRNPYRFSIDPQTSRIWVGDVGWNDKEEIDYIPSATAAAMNFGWPCYEGAARQGGWDAANKPICETLYGSGLTTSPYYEYGLNGDPKVISAIALYRGSNFPSTYNGALFFGDYSQRWIKVMFPGANGLPNINNIVDFIDDDVWPVDMQIGANGALYYVDIVEGSVHQISYFTANTPPTANATSDKNAGALPLSVTFDGSTSIESDAGDSLDYAWDLDGDGAFDDSTAISPVHNYTQAQTVTVRLRVTDEQNASNIDTLTIYAGNRPPTATINTPVAGTLFSVGQVISFSGSANDPDSGNLPSNLLKWDAVLQHCSINNPNECHNHDIQSFNGVTSGSFNALDHEYPSRIELRLTATDPTVPGLTTVVTRTLQPRTTTWNFTSNPSGLQLAVYSATATTPFSRTVIVGASSTISAPAQQLGGNSYAFASWSDGGAITHTVTAGTSAQTFNATFAQNTSLITILGKDFVIKTTGGPTWNGDGGWIIWANGNIANSINFPQAGQYNVVINALGELAGSDLPRMELRVNGVAVGAVNVGNTADYAPFSFNINVPASGNRQLAIAFTNDFTGGGADRNLYIYNMIVSSGAPSAVCGDGIKNGSEQCDGTSGVGPNQSCSAQCTLINNPFCGDGIKNGSEQCDGTSGVGPNQSCSAQCTLINLPYCGDGIKNGSEQCDGTSGVGPGQSCNSQCTLVSGSFNFFILAKDMSYKPIGAITSDGSWNLQTNGFIGHSINFPQTGQYTITITARGDLAGTELPKMDVLINSVTKKIFNIDSAGYKTYVVVLNVAAGSRQLGIGFTNDLNNASGNRNVIVKDVTVTLGTVVTPPPTAFSFAINAQDMSVKTVGQAIYQGWNLWSSGYLGHNVNFPQAGTYKVKVTAKGELAGPELPKMEIRLDGVAKATINVSATAWTAHEVSFSIPSGSHQIAVAFINDYYANGADRNLHVQKVEITNQ